MELMCDSVIHWLSIKRYVQCTLD